MSVIGQCAAKYMSLNYYCLQILVLILQTTFAEQMKGLKKTGESFRHTIESLERGIYPINLKLPGDQALQEKQSVIESFHQEIQILKTQIESLEKEANEKAIFQRKNETLLLKTNTLQEQITSIKRASDRNLKDKEEMAQEITSVRKTNTSLQQEVAGLKEQVSDLKRQNYLLEEENASNSRKAEDLRRQLEIQRKRQITGTCAVIYGYSICIFDILEVR